MNLAPINRHNGSDPVFPQNAIVNYIKTIPLLMIFFFIIVYTQKLFSFMELVAILALFERLVKQTFLTLFFYVRLKY